MKIKVEIIKNSTGEKRVYEPDYPINENNEDDIDVLKYIWTEGNYGCDCNRHLRFHDILPSEGDGRKCGDTEYTVPRILLEDGREIIIDRKK